MIAHKGTVMPTLAGRSSAISPLNMSFIIMISGAGKE